MTDSTAKTPESKKPKRGTWYARSQRAQELRERRLKSLRKRRDLAQIERPTLNFDDMLRVSRVIPGYDPFRCDDRFEFVPEFALEAVDWIHDNCFHSDDRWAGQQFILSDWQMSIVANLAGWVDEEGLRRFVETLIYVARKNGKTAFAAALLQLFLFHLSVAGAQLYGVAAEFDQASHVWKHAKLSIEANERLHPTVKINSGMSDRSITVIEDDSVYRVMTSKGKTKHGQNPYVLLCDELHVIDDATLIEAVETSFGARREYLLAYLTTADYDRESLCNRKYEYAKRVAAWSRGEDAGDEVHNDTFLPVIYEIPRDVDYRDEKNWPLANPNLGITPSVAYLRKQVQRAQDDPTFENSVRRLHFNQRTEQETRAIVMSLWDDAVEDPIDLESLKSDSVVAMGAVDAAAKIDIAAWIMEFRLADGTYLWIPRFFVPAESAKARELKDKVPYETWGRQGFLTMTEGSTIDHDHIRDQIVEDCSAFGIKYVAYDEWNAVQLATQLQKTGLSMIKFVQLPKHYNEPTKDFIAQLGAKNWMVPLDPVFRWMAGNLAVTVDVNDNYMPNKKKSGDKIDGLTAGLMAHGLMMVKGDEPKPDPSKGLNFI